MFSWLRKATAALARLLRLLLPLLLRQLLRQPPLLPRHRQLRLHRPRRSPPARRHPHRLAHPPRPRLPPLSIRYGAASPRSTAPRAPMVSRT